MPPKKAVKMNLSAFHKGHVGEDDNNLPIGPSGIEDFPPRGGRFDEDRERRPRFEDEAAPSRADEGEWRSAGSSRRSNYNSGFNDRGPSGGGFRDRTDGGFRERPADGPSRSDEGWRTNRFDDRSDFRGRRDDNPGDVRMDRPSGYRPLALKPRGAAGEASESSSSSSRRSDPYGSSSSSRGQDRDRDVVKIHQKEDDAKRTEKPKREEAKPAVEEPPAKSALERALDEKSTVSVDALSQGLAGLKLSAEQSPQLTEVLVKSIIGKKLSLKEAVTALQAKPTPETPAVVVSVLQSLKEKKGEGFMLSQTSDFNVLEVIAKKLQGKELDSFLAEKQLQELTPVPEINKWVSNSLSEEKLSVDAVLAHIKQNTDAKQSLPSLGAVVAERMGQLMFREATPNLELITKFSKLLRRTVCEPKNDFKGQAGVLFAVQTAWSDAKFPKGLKDVFQKLYNEKLVFYEAFDIWREDRSNKAPNKHKALVQVNSFLETIKPKEEVEEDEGDEEEEEADEE